ncbi:MAG: ABC transporter permease [Alphaproteobacteria bacterium]|nr:ABC transporter permease [Alphaproteobacteria bacterium]
MSNQNLAPLGRMFLAQCRSDLTVHWRTPAFTVSSLVLPIVFFTFFGLTFVDRTSAQGYDIGAFILASFACYGVGAVLVYGFGIGVAIERGMKVDLLIRASPNPGAIFLGAKVAVAMFFALTATVLLIGYGVIIGGIHEPMTVWLSLTARLLIGSVPLMGLGLAIGYSVGPQAAPAVANLLYLPLTFASGLFVPLSQLPPFVQQIAYFLPTYHVGQLAWGALGASTVPVGTSVSWLVGYGVAFFLLAALAYRREEQRRFG